MNPFDEVKQVFTTKDFQLKNPWMVNRLLSYVPETFALSARLNRFIGYIPAWAMIETLRYCVKKRGVAPFIKYIKAERIKDPELVKKICTHLCCNEGHAVETIEVLRVCGHEPERFFGLKKGE